MERSRGKSHSAQQNVCHAFFALTFFVCVPNTFFPPSHLGSNAISCIVRQRKKVPCIPPQNFFRLMFPLFCCCCSIPFISSHLSHPISIFQVHPCGRYRHNTVVFILAKEFNLKNLRTIHRLDRLTSGLLLFGRSPKKARQMEHQIRNRQVQKQYMCRVEGNFPE